MARQASSAWLRCRLTPSRGPRWAYYTSKDPTMGLRSSPGAGDRNLPGRPPGLLFDRFMDADGGMVSQEDQEDQEDMITRW